MCKSWRKVLSWGNLHDTSRVDSRRITNGTGTEQNICTPDYLQKTDTVVTKVDAR
jgi:hypothetical protein